MEAALSPATSAGGDGLAGLTVGERVRVLRARTPAPHSPTSDPDQPGFVPLSQRSLAELANQHLPDYRRGGKWNGNERTTAGPKWGLTYAYISRIEAGARRPSVPALRAMAAVFGISPNVLEFGEETSPELAAAHEQIARLEKRIVLLEGRLAAKDERLRALRAELRETWQ